MNHTKRTISIALLFLILPPALVLDAADNNRNVEISLGLGSNFDGRSHVDPPYPDLDAEGRFFSKVTFDYFPSDYLGFGLYTSYGHFAIDDAGVRDGVDLFEIGVGVKPRYPFYDIMEGSDFFFTPGLGIGYRRGVVDKFDNGDFHGLGLNFGVDFRLRFEDPGLEYGIDFFVEPGFTSQPFGRFFEESDLDITYEPIAYVSAGIGIAF